MPSPSSALDFPTPFAIAANVRKAPTNVATLGDWDLPEDFLPAGIDEQGGGIFAVDFWCDDEWGLVGRDHALVLYGPDAPDSELLDCTDGFDLIPF